MEKEYLIISKNLKKYLEKRKMSQRELAEKTGLTEVTISRYVSGSRVPVGPVVAKLADALKCSCDDLLY